VLIYEAFRWPLPEFAHLSTILGSDHTRLSKRHGATSIKNLQDLGVLPEALLNYLALLGWAPKEGQGEILPLDELIQSFELEQVSKSPAVFDLNKLYWVNRHYIKECERGRLMKLVLPFLKENGLIATLDDDGVREWVTQMIEMVVPGLDHLSELPAKAAFIFDFDPAAGLRTDGVQHVLAEGAAVEVIEALDAELSQPGREVPRDWKDIIGAVKAKTKAKGKQLFHPIRVALTGTEAGPELDRIIPLLETGSRLKLAKCVLSCRDRVAAFVAALRLKETSNS
jgi:glutamyl-tRNA synthetase/nondiscriminating glutamyl-tRNA synthetase